MPSGATIRRPAPRAGSTPTWRGSAGSSSRTGHCAGPAACLCRPEPATCCTWWPASRTPSPSSSTWPGPASCARPANRRARWPPSTPRSACGAAARSPESRARSRKRSGRGLAEMRSAAAEERADVLLLLGRHEEVVPDLTAMVADHPLRERMRGLLMIALYRSGRQAEALRVYAEGRRVLADELGIDPGSDLSRVHLQVLTMDAALNLAVPAARIGADHPDVTEPGAEGGAGPRAAAD